MLLSVTAIEVTGPAMPETVISLGYASAVPRVTAGCPRGIVMAALLLNDCAVAGAGGGDQRGDNDGRSGAH